MLKTVCWFIDSEGNNYRLRGSADHSTASIERFSPAGREIVTTGAGAQVAAQYAGLASEHIDAHNRERLAAWQAASGYQPQPEPEVTPIFENE